MAIISKSAAEYLRRKNIRLSARNLRESSAIRYQNQNTPVSKQIEEPMPDWVVQTDNLRPGREHN